jgi:hypothetical protein
MGKFFDNHGVRFTPIRAVKNAKRYRYYPSQAVIRKASVKPAGTRFTAEDLEQPVGLQILRLVQAPGKCIAGMKSSPDKDAAAERTRDLAKSWFPLAVSKKNEFIRSILNQVIISNPCVD